jgi:hypothetical protein
VAVANGDRVTSLGYCPALDINIAGENFVICCYGLLLGSYDMVLGVQWLESHGPIHWDFGRHTLAFVPNGRHVLWSAAASPLSTPTLAAASLDMMDDLLLQYTPLRHADRSATRLQVLPSDSLATKHRGSGCPTIPLRLRAKGGD